MAGEFRKGFCGVLMKKTATTADTSHLDIEDLYYMRTVSKRPNLSDASGETRMPRKQGMLPALYTLTNAHNLILFKHILAANRQFLKYTKYKTTLQESPNTPRSHNKKSLQLLQRHQKHKSGILIR